MLLLFQPGKLEWDNDLITNASQSLETLVAQLSTIWLMTGSRWSECGTSSVRCSGDKRE